MGYENLSVPFGTTDVSADVLVHEERRDRHGRVLLRAVHGAGHGHRAGPVGLKAKSLSFASADSSLFADPTAAAAAQGLYYSSTIPPMDTNNAAPSTFEANIKAVDPS